MEDYQGNAKKDKEPKKGKPEKKIEKVISGDVTIQKKSLARKFRDMIIEADMRSVGHYLFTEVLIPAFKGVVSDAMNKGTDRVLYGERRRGGYGIGGGGGPRVTYNNPINRGNTPRDGDRSRYTERPSITRGAVRARDEFILSSKDEAELVLERMTDVIDSYDSVSVADMNEMVGLSFTPIDNKWGWVSLADAQIRQIREGFVIDLPQPEVLN